MKNGWRLCWRHCLIGEHDQLINLTIIAHPQRLAQNWTPNIATETILLDERGQVVCDPLPLYVQEPLVPYHVL